MEHLLERRGAADLADLRIRIGHPMEHLEQVSVRAAEFVDRHEKIKASRGIRRPLAARMVRHSMDETATTLPVRATGLPRFRAATRELDRRLFVGGVSAITAAVAVFLFVQLDKWPPHEDETLPLFVGRHSLSGALRHRPRQARRGAAPLPARLDRRAHGRRAPRDARALRRCSRSRASRRSRSSATGSPGARPPSPPPRSRRGAGCCSSTGSTRGCTACSCSSRRSRTSSSSAR